MASVVLTAGWGIADSMIFAGVSIGVMTAWPGNNKGYSLITIKKSKIRDKNVLSVFTQGILLYHLNKLFSENKKTSSSQDFSINPMAGNDPGPGDASFCPDLYRQRHLLLCSWQ
jgi:hypothetical protein